MRDSVSSPRYSPVCNVLCQWKTSLIPTYRVYRLYDMYIYKYINSNYINIAKIQQIEKTRVGSLPLAQLDNIKTGKKD